MRQKTGLDALDLPTKAQWEYACRAGTTTDFNNGKNLTSNGQCPNMAEVGRYWYNGGSGSSDSCATNAGTAAVGSYKPNVWGLYDMYGNVWAKEHVDYLLHTGDLIDFQSRANFDLVKKYYGEGGAMMFGCLGNHEHYRGKKMAKKDGTPIVPAVVPDLLKESYPFPNDFCSTVINGVNFITIDDSTDTVSADQATRFEAEAKKGLPIILCMHCPFPTREIVRAASRFWRRSDLKTIRDMGSFVESEKYKDATTKDFVAYLRAQPLLKGILCGHGHLNVVDNFSPTAKQYEVAGNFMFCGQEFTIS